MTIAWCSPSTRRALAHVAPIETSARFFSWYWSVLTKLPTFTAGYIAGGIVVGLMMTVPSLAYAAIRLALARIP